MERIKIWWSYQDHSGRGLEICSIFGSVSQSRRIFGALTTVAQWSRLQTAAVGCEDLRGHGTRPVSANQRPYIPGIDQWEDRVCVSNPPESPHFVSVCSLKAGSVWIWEIHVAFTLPCTFNVSEGGYRRVEMEKGRVGKLDDIETWEEGLPSSYICILSQPIARCHDWCDPKLHEAYVMFWLIHPVEISINLPNSLPSISPCDKICKI